MKPFHLSTQNTEALNCRLCLKDSLNPSFIKAWIWKFAHVTITHQPTICSPPQPPTASHLVAREFLPTSNSSQSCIFHFMLIWVLVGLDLSLTLWFDILPGKNHCNFLSMHWYLKETKVRRKALLTVSKFFIRGWVCLVMNSDTAEDNVVLKKVFVDGVAYSPGHFLPGSISTHVDELCKARSTTSVLRNWVLNCELHFIHFYPQMLVQKKALHLTEKKVASSCCFISIEIAAFLASIGKGRQLLTCWSVSSDLQPIQISRPL